MKTVYLKQGYITVKKSTLKEHCNILRNCLGVMDIVMKQKESVQRGKIIAKLMNKIDFSRQIIEHQLLNIPLEKTGDYTKQLK